MEGAAASSADVSETAGSSQTQDGFAWDFLIPSQ